MKKGTCSKGHKGVEKQCVPSELICKTKLEKSLFPHDFHGRISVRLQAGGEGAESVAAEKCRCIAAISCNLKIACHNR